MIFAFVLFFVFVAWIIFRANTKRGKNFVQSFYYLSCLKSGKSAEEANRLAHNIFTPTSDTHRDRQLKKRATEFSQEKYNGKQLPVIREAASQGFII